MYRAVALCIASLIVLIPATPPLAPFMSPVIPTLQAPPRHAPTTTIGDAWTAIAPESAPATVAQNAPTVPTLVHTPPPTSAPLATRTPLRIDAAMWRRWERMQE